MTSILIRGGTIITDSDQTQKDFVIDDHVIHFDRTDADETIDATGKLIFPGLIDCHVHFREPGYEHKATMESESAAAKAGGVFTVCEMPNTKPPTVTVAALADKVRRAALIENFDMRFFFGITEDAHLHTLIDLFTSSSEELMRLRKRCCGVKIYLEHSTGNQKIDEKLIPQVFSKCADLDIPIVAHCEDPATIDKAMKFVERTDIAAHSAIRQAEAEAKAIEYAIDQARKSEARLHVAHISTKEGAELVRNAKREGLFVTCEVTTHHLFLSTDDYEKLGTFAKVNPPLRTKDHVEALWEAIADKTIDCIATDHAPHTIEEKNSPEPLSAPSGMPGVETLLPLLLSVVSGESEKFRIENGELKMEDIYRLCFENPNTIFKLGKSGIEDGKMTNVIIVDPKAEWTISAKNLHSKCGWTPYEGWNVKGKISVIH